MDKVVLLVWSLVLSSFGGDFVEAQFEQFVFRNFSVENIINFTQTAPATQGLPMTLCSQFCLMTPGCSSAVYDSKLKTCYTFPVMQSVGSAFAETDRFQLLQNTSGVETEQGRRCCCVDLRIRGVASVYEDCQHAFEEGERQNGIYYLELEGGIGVIAPCVFDDNSGWTVIQARVDGSVDFFRNWTSFSEGFGFVDTEFWLGLGNIHLLTQVNSKLSIFLEAHDGETRTANYSTFKVAAGTVNYQLNLAGYTGDAGDSFSDLNGNIFRTYDRDNSVHCARDYKGGWWYGACHQSNLNGIYYPGGVTTSYADGAVWKGWKEYYYSYKTIYMRITK